MKIEYYPKTPYGKVYLEKNSLQAITISSSALNTVNFKNTGGLPMMVTKRPYEKVTPNLSYCTNRPEGVEFTLSRCKSKKYKKNKETRKINQHSKSYI